MNILFLHVPKCGGESVFFALKSQGVAKYGHNAREGQNYEFLSKKHNDQYDFIFCNFRHPHDRLVSAWTFMAERNTIEFREYLGKYNTFKNFIVQGGIDIAIRKQIHCFPQITWIGTADVMIYPFEKLQESVDNVCVRCGLKRVFIPHRKKHKRGKWEEYYDDETYQIVDDMYSEDKKIWESATKHFGLP